jgi:hypothetical protein
MDPDQTARMRRLVWIHAGRKHIMLVLIHIKHTSIKTTPDMAVLKCDKYGPMK